MSVPVYDGGMRRHLSTNEMIAAFSEMEEGEIISDAMAQTIASWWHSPRRMSTAALSTAGIVTSDADIDEFADPEEYDNCDDQDKQYLDALRDYIADKKSDYLTRNPFLCPVCFELAARDLNKFNYRVSVQHTECEHCYEDLRREWNGFRWSGWGPAL